MHPIGLPNQMQPKLTFSSKIVDMGFQAHVPTIQSNFDIKITTYSDIQKIKTIRQAQRNFSLSPSVVSCKHRIPLIIRLKILLQIVVKARIMTDGAVN